MRSAREAVFDLWSAADVMPWNRGSEGRPMEPDWAWRYEGYDPPRERLREALCTLGNGYFATRGAAAEEPSCAGHYPGTYAAGCYNRLTSVVAGREVENEDLVNLPNWLPLRFRAAGGEWFTPDCGSLLAYEQVLDLRRGTLQRRMRLRDAAGREVTLEETRLVHMADPHLAGQRTRVTAQGWMGDLEIEAGIDGSVSNDGVERYRDLNGRHLIHPHTGTWGTDTVCHSGVISQFDGYGDLAELDWTHYRRRYGDIRRLDRILEAEGDSVNRYQASKQADVLMLGYLFPPAELASLFGQLGHRLDDGLWNATVDHYLARTSHGSTLSGLVHGWVLARSRRAKAWTYVREALLGDVADVQGGTTGEGVHLGAMAGTLDLVHRGLTGLEPRPDALRLDPVPLPELSRFHLSVRYRTHWGVGLTLHSGHLHVSVPDSDESQIKVVLGERAFCVAPGTEAGIDLPDG
jgi:trehalose/maltose hydrolase-like predicted phosphorylase